MTPHEFIRRWKATSLSERASCQPHFLDLCALLGEPNPIEADPQGEWYAFEKGVTTPEGHKGFADVWKRGCFGWEYKRKGKYKTLREAYVQLRKYSEALENPPLLVVCDIDRFEIHANFTKYPQRVETLTLGDIADPAKLAVLRRVFQDPDWFKPGVTREQVTREIAERFCKVAEGLRSRRVNSERAAHFLVRIVFCMFVEHAGLLIENCPASRVFTTILRNSRRNPKLLSKFLTELFDKMAHGGFFGTEQVRHFNGGLFNDAEVIDLTPREIDILLECVTCDWSELEPTISGTLFERIIDPNNRAQLGAHFTSPEEIETLLRPVFIDPLRREWDAVRAEADELWAKLQPAAREASLATRHPADRKLKDRSHRARDRFDACLHRFFDRLSTLKVLDPACGSGNFLYVALRMLLELHKEVWQYASMRGVSRIEWVSPRQFYGLDVNEYARELAETMLWVGYIQWEQKNPIRDLPAPVLSEMQNVRSVDAILDTNSPDGPKEPEWPDAEFIFGNPPFLGGKQLRSRLGDRYVDRLFQVWGERVEPQADLCCYWFEKARAMVQSERARRVGLLATQGIRGGANRTVLSRIKRTGDIFFGVSDRDWWDDGTAVHISMVGFDNGTEKKRILDGQPVATINANLTATADTTQARRLSANLGIGFMGDTKGGPFNIPFATARKLLDTPNVNGRPSSDVVIPWCNGLDVTRRNRDVWIIDYPLGTAEAEASHYDTVFGLLKPLAKAARGGSRSKVQAWWLHERPRVDMREKLVPLDRFIAVPRVAKHLMFVWMKAPTLPDCQVIVFGLSDDYSFGVLHSRVHELWALRMGTRLETRPRYTPTTCFETFPFPEPFAGHEEAIGAAAKALDARRNRWLNPPEWTRTEMLEFSGSVDGPWRRYVTDADPDTGIGTVRYPRTVPKDAASAAKLKERTLTNLYNESPAWLQAAHRELDELVFQAYGWSPDLSDDDLLARLLELNLSRAAAPACPAVTVSG